MSAVAPRAAFSKKSSMRACTSVSISRTTGHTSIVLELQLLYNYISTPAPLAHLPDQKAVHTAPPYQQSGQHRSPMLAKRSTPLPQASKAVHTARHANG